MKNLFTLFAFLLFCLTGFCQEEQYVFPADAGVLDVTKAPYNADNTGTVDATAAIQAALDAYPNGNRTIYLPEGIYLISNTLKWPEGSGGSTYKRTMIQGETTSGTIIKLKDNCEGYQNPESRKAMIYTGPAPAQRFRNAIRGITVNTGTGNPGACGIQFNCSNEGTMQHVKIISGDGQGVYGLDLAFTNEIGPGYIYDLTVEGFDVGIMHGFAINSMTFEKITLKNQNECAYRNSGNVAQIRNLKSDNTVPAIECLGVSSTLVLLDAEFSGGNPDTAAIFNKGTLYARNINQSGYGLSIDSEMGLKIDVENTYVKEYCSHGLMKQFHSPAKSLNLPVKDWPELPWSELSEWANVMDYGAKGDGSTDDTQAIQDAIDAGKETVYFPGGYNFKLNGTVSIRGNVKRIIGCEGKLSGNGGFLCENDMQDTVVIERINALYANIDLVFNSSKTLVLNSITAIPVVSNGSGDMFIINNVFGVLELNNKDQNIWIRHLNTEDGEETNIVNKGATLWMLGYKTERGKTKIHTLDGGKTELLGSHNYSTTGEKTDPWFVVENASLSIAGARETNYNGAPYTEYVTEIRGSDTKTLDRVYFPSGGAGGGVIPLYNGYENDEGFPVTPENLKMEQVGIQDWLLTWNEILTDDIDYYSVYITETSGGPYQMIGNYLKEPGFVFTSEKYATYYFVVSSVNTNGNESMFPEELEVIIQEPGKPKAPLGLKGISYGDSIVLSWEKNKEFEIDYYEIYRNDPPSAFFLVKGTGIKDTSWTDHSIQEGKQYNYRMTAVSLNGLKSDYSDTIEIYPLAIHKAANQVDFTVYPVPAKNELKIRTDASRGEYEVLIFNSMGALIQRKLLKTDEDIIFLDNYMPGTYFIQLKKGDKKGIQNFVIER
jgi:hypothetical protein